MTEKPRHRRSCRRWMRIIQSIIGTIALPLLLGVFTVVITFQQKSDAYKQRIEDRHLADEQRDQDLNISRLQRAFDLNQSRLQLDLDRSLADQKRQQDYEIANKTRELSASNQLHEYALELQRHRDALLVSYINEIIILLKENNGSSTKDPLLATLVRLKTLTLIRQLDPFRKSELIRFLYEAKQLHSTGNHIDLSGAELNGITLCNTTSEKNMHGLFLASVSLQNSSFANCDLTGSNFYKSILKGVDMTNTTLHNTNMSYTSFDKLSLFVKTILIETIFLGSHFYEVDFSNTQTIKKVNFVKTIIDHCCFSGITLYNVNFTMSTLKYVDFCHTYFEKVNMRSNVVWHNLNFTNTYFNASDFYYVTIRDSTFDNAYFEYGIFDVVFFSNTTFENSTLTKSEFHRSRFSRIDFSSSSISDTKWISSTFNQSLFYNIYGKNILFRSNICRANFGFSYFENITFEYCTMPQTSFFKTLFVRPIFIGNDLSYTNFSQANLLKAHFKMMNDFTSIDLRNSSGITEEDLQSALSVDYAYFSNGSQGEYKPLIQNGHAECNISVYHDWIVENGNITVEPSKEDPTNCYFVPMNIKNDSNVYITQKVNATRYKDIITKNRAVILFWGRAGYHTYVGVKEIDLQGKILQDNAYPLTDSSQFLFNHRIKLNNFTVELEVFIYLAAFATAEVNQSYWADFIEIKIDLDRSNI